MNLAKKVNITFIALLLCLIVLVSATVAWLTISLSPEVTSIDTNVGANGSLEIALLSNTTYVDPQLIRTSPGDSAAVQNPLESNLSWGNVVELSDEAYGMAQLSLHPARLNLQQGENGFYINGSLLKVAEFGIDGRISILSDQTVSAIHEENSFVYYVEKQNYGVRAIGTISHIALQQTALASARTLSQSYTASASRTAKNVWRDSGPLLMDIFSRRYADGQTQFTAVDIEAVKSAATQMQQALQYTELTIRQGIIGAAASRTEDEMEFENIYSMLNNNNMPLSVIINSAGGSIPGDFKTWIDELNTMKADVQTVITGCGVLAGRCTWEQLEPLLDVLVNADKVYLEDYTLSKAKAYENLKENNLSFWAVLCGQSFSVSNNQDKYKNHRYTDQALHF